MHNIKEQRIKQRGSNGFPFLSTKMDISTHMQAPHPQNTKKPQVSLLEVSSHSDLAVSYSHMGKPHTTI
ncbi:hypothetical protein ACFGXR_10510, partial [Pasteurella multocida]